MRLEIPIEYREGGGAYCPVEVSAIFEMHGYRFGAHRPWGDISDTVWIVSELSTGCRVVTGKTRKGAVAYAQDRLASVTQAEMDSKVKTAFKQQKKMKLRRQAK